MVYTSGVSVSVSMTKDYSLLCQSQLLTWCVHHRFDEEVQEDTHGSFTPEMMKFPQATRIETFLEGVTDKNTGLPIFKEPVWFFLTRSLVSSV